MNTNSLVTTIKQKYDLLLPWMDERQKRLWAAAEVSGLGRGGRSIVAEATGLARMTINRGMAELAMTAKQCAAERHRLRKRRVSDGRRLVESDPKLLVDIDKLLEQSTDATTRSPVRWTRKGTRALAKELNSPRHRVCARSVAALLHRSQYLLLGRRQSEKPSANRQWKMQLQFVNDLIRTEVSSGNPVVHIVLRKKYLSRQFDKTATALMPVDRVESPIYARLNRAFRRSIPRSAAGLLSPQNWLATGVDSATAPFVAKAARCWWEQLGRQYHGARELSVIADGGLERHAVSWQMSLQQLADELGLRIRVAHVPPMSLKWDAVTQQLAALCPKPVRGRQGLGWLAIVNALGSPVTDAGRTIRAVRDLNRYVDRDGRTTMETDDEVQITWDKRRQNWNYTLSPRQ